MNRRVVAAACLIGTGLMGLGVARRQPGDGPDRAGELMAQIVELRQKRLEAILLQNQLITDVDPDRYLVLLDAADDLANARVRLARHQSDRAAEEQALTELLELTREYVEEVRGREFGVSRLTVADVQSRALEAELRVELFRTR